MTCENCGAKMTTAIENYKYDACGLPYVTLCGVEVARCKSCGEHEVSIPAIEDLHKAIAGTLITMPTRLGPLEIKFLRKYLGWSGVDFARHMGVDPATVSKWENGKEGMGSQSERLLRVMVLLLKPARSYPLESVLAFQDEARPAQSLKLKKSSRSWQPQEALV